MTAAPAGDVRTTLDPELTPALRDEIVECWVAVTNAGGAVGFVPPVDRDDVGPTADATFAAVGTGENHLLVARAGDGSLVGWLVLESRGTALSRHWRTLKRVQVHPRHQGCGHGAALLAGADAAARSLGLDALHLTVRGGTGTEAFYLRYGYVEVGRIPRALLLGDGDYRDELYLVRPLGERPA